MLLGLRDGPLGVAHPRFTKVFGLHAWVVTHKTLAEPYLTLTSERLDNLARPAGLGRRRRLLPGRPPHYRPLIILIYFSKRRSRTASDKSALNSGWQPTALSYFLLFSDLLT